MKQTFWNKRIPTIFGLLLIVLGIGITSYLAQTGSILKSNAGPSAAPKDVQITNVTDSSATISYVTVDTVLGSVTYGKQAPFSLTAIDQRDQENAMIRTHNTHIFSLKNLLPQTKYSFAIISGQDTYLTNGTYYMFTTGPALNPRVGPTKPITGNVMLPDGSHPTDALLYISANGMQPLVTIVKPDGTYIMPLTTARTGDLSDYMQFTQSSQLQLLSTNGAFSSSITTNINNGSVPLITLSQNYDFTTLTQTTASSSAKPNLQLFQTLIAEKNAGNSTPKILSPQPYQNFTDQTPQFRGTAAPDTRVSITIHSPQTIYAQTTTDALGNWTYRPTDALSVGIHTITVTMQDISGNTKTVTQTFTVYASGTQVFETATPSATLTPTLLPSPTQAPIITALPTLAPTASPVPTGIVTAIPTTYLSPSPQPVLPPTGSSSPTIVMGIVGATITCIGMLLFFFI